MKYKVGDKVFLVIDCVVTGVNSENEFLPYSVENKHLGLDAWVNEDGLSLTRPQETEKVELTEEEAEFLESFGDFKSEALYRIGNYGWDEPLLDGNGDSKEDLLPSPSFEHKRKLLNALVNGYTVANEPKTGMTTDEIESHMQNVSRLIAQAGTSPVTDNVNRPDHYQGKYGMESVEIIDNFIGNLVGKAAWCWGNAIKYLLRFQKKNGLEDLKKARKNLDWLIEEMEKEQ